MAINIEKNVLFVLFLIHICCYRKLDESHYEDFMLFCIFSKIALSEGFTVGRLYEIVSKS